MVGTAGTNASSRCVGNYTTTESGWTFVEVQGIEPTNNAAELALCPAVIYRKLSFGTQSEASSSSEC